MLQVDEDLVDALHDRGFLLQIETNGTREVTPGIDFITVSPKVAEHCIRQRQAHEVKYVRHHTQGVPRTVVDADHYWLSPAFLGDMPDPRAMEHCQRLAAQNPPWKVSVQAHKLWGVR